MKFCDRCGSYMEMTAEGYLCPRCGNVIQADEIEVKRAKEPQAEAVYVVKGAEEDSLRVNRTCPLCGHHEAFRYISASSGEHAGVKQERTVNRYKCAKCLHTWIES